MAKYSVTEVFTPTTQARASFIERADEVNGDLVDALQTPGKQIILYGHSGSGKSTLIVNKLDQLYESHITTRCAGRMTFEQIVLDAFDQLAVYYIDATQSTKSKTIGASIGADYLAIKSSLGVEATHAATASQRRILPPQLTAQRLCDFLGSLGCCWIIEDFHKIADTEKRHLAEQLKVVVDKSLDYPELKVIVIGAVDSARELIHYNKDLNARVAEILVPLLTDDELLQILSKGEELLNVAFNKSQKNRIVKFSSGLGAICHQLALNMCFESGITRTVEKKHVFTDRDFDLALKKYVRSCSDTLKERYDRATRVDRKRTFENGKIILFAIIQSDQEELSHSDILTQVRKKHTAYPASNLSQYLPKLVTDDRGNVLHLNPANGKYSFSDPFIRTFVRYRFETASKNEQTDLMIDLDKLWTMALFSFDDKPRYRK